MADHADMEALTGAIEQHRAALLADLEELRVTVQRRFDPSEHIRAHARAAVLIAFTTGMLLGLVLVPGPNTRRRR
jgi:hypothetical protein